MSPCMRKWSAPCRLSSPSASMTSPGSNASSLKMGARTRSKSWMPASRRTRISRRVGAPYSAGRHGRLANRTAGKAEIADAGPVLLGHGRGRLVRPGGDLWMCRRRCLDEPEHVVHAELGWRASKSRTQEIESEIGDQLVLERKQAIAVNPRSARIRSASTPTKRPQRAGSRHRAHTSP